MRAFVFPGQGSQKVGMGADLADASATARAVFDEVDDALSQNLSTIMRDGPEAELTLTENAQPAIMANAIATLRILEQDFGVSLAETGHCVAGHSLGEYTALCAVGALSLSETAQLLKLRGRLFLLDLFFLFFLNLNIIYVFHVKYYFFFRAKDEANNTSYNPKYQVKHLVCYNIIAAASEHIGALQG